MRKNRRRRGFEPVSYTHLETGEASNTSEAVKLAGISRSVYYKYKNAVFPYTKKETGAIMTVQVVLIDKPGVLVNLLTV